MEYRSKTHTLFLVIHGQLRMEFRDQVVLVSEGEFIAVPHGVEHRPVAEEAVHILLFEQTETRNTGNVTEERTREQPDRI